MPAPRSATCPACGRVAATSDQRFCGGCGGVLPASGDTATGVALVMPAQEIRPGIAGKDGERFLPGTVLAGRYRMVALLGRGGMGEVYRADDLKLGQSVALKFLPADVEGDPDRLERFLTEVRLSLRVTHPNICRVFDIGQLDERHFLSMEYVDGEDLASLLRRIGRLPEDKAVEIARQLCAGLSAAHDGGVLHRDLKPANIMIDGRGRAKITDFGVASVTGISGPEARAGTPQYMAPEQAAGRELSERTDLYALGLVLYELFTGKQAFEISNLDDRQRLESSVPSSPSSHVSGMNPLVERAILRCLDPDPARRPASAAALAAALPGGDPLAMALAAGDTPSPEMVAAAGTDVRIRPGVAWGLVALAAAGVVITSWLAQSAIIHRVGAPLRPLDVMVERARDVLRSTGRTEVRDSAWNLAPDHGYLTYMASGEAADPLGGMAAHGLRFWYRESPVTLERLAFITGPELLQMVMPFDPAIKYSGEALLQLDRQGSLVSLTVVPPQRAGDVSAADLDWAPLFRAAGLDIAEWSDVEPEWTPHFHADRRLAWRPTRPRLDDVLRVEAASFRGHPVSFAIVLPWTTADRQLATRRTTGERIANLVMVLIFTAVVLGSMLVARRNLRLERADTRGATNVAAAVAALHMAGWALDEQHVASIWELYLFLMGAAWALLMGALVAVSYLALEPYVRRTWPHMIVSWSRVMAGAIRDPLVARDVLIGVTAGALLQGINAGGLHLTRVVTGLPPRMGGDPRPFLGGLHTVSALLLPAAWAVFFALALLFVLFSLRKLLRFETAAIAVGSVLLTIPAVTEYGTVVGALPFLLANVLMFALLARIGVVATIAASFVSTVLYNFPAVIPPAGWYAGVGWVGPAVVLALAVLALRIASAPAERDARRARKLT
ncbi:MAG: protein kinase domain-containing protein [Acidobacteriota bacterium]